MDIYRQRSDDANQIVQFMLLKLSSIKYGPISIIRVCFDNAIHNYGYCIPIEPKDSICEFVKDILNSIDDDVKL